MAVLSVLSAGVLAAEADKTQKLQVTVVSVTGQAQRLTAGKTEEWVQLKAGEKLDELTIIRTGLRSKVVLKFEDRGETVVNATSKVGIEEFSRTGTLVKSRLGLKYGTMRATVDSTRGPNDAEISTAVATLSVSGTGGDIAYTGDRGLGLHGRSGEWRVAAGNRSRHVVAGESTNSYLTRSMALIKQQRGVTLGDVFGGLSPIEVTQQNYNPNPRTVSGLITTISDTGTTTDITPTPSPPGHIIVGF